MIIPIQNMSWDKVWQGVDDIRDRLIRVTRILDDAGIAYAVIGGNAVGTWVGTVDRSMIRTTTDVDLLISRSDLESVRKALELGGFIYQHSAASDMFLDGSRAKARDAVHALFAGEKVRQEYEVPAPALTESVRTEHYRVLALEPLVLMKLTSFRRKDQVHLQDLIAVGLVDDSWPDRFAPVLAERLREILATPEG